MKVYKPSIDELRPLKAEATNNGEKTEAEWQRGMCKVTAQILDEDPRSYRAYGPYWWIMKQAMLANGYTRFGDSLDREWIDNMDYGDTTWNMLAAWLYQDTAQDNGMRYSNGHPIVTMADENAFPEDGVYTLIDDDMEILAAAKPLL